MLRKGALHLCVTSVSKKYLETFLHASNFFKLQQYAIL